MTAPSESKFRIATAAFAGMVVSSPAVFSVNPLLLTPMVGEFGWGRSTIAAGYVVAAPVMAIMYLLVGPLYDRLGVRRILVPGIILFSLATMLLAQLSGSIVQFLLIKALVAACGSLITGIAFGKVISRHFSTNRGLMLGLCLGAGGGMGMAVLPLIGGYVFAAEGWRMTYVAMGAIAFLIGMPAALALPRDGGDQAAGPARPDGDGMTAREALHSRSFALLLLTTFFACAALNGTQAHMAAIMTDAGLSSADAAISLSIYAAALMCGQFAIGWLLDRISSPRLGIPVFAIVLAGILLLHFGTGRVPLFLGATLMGLGAGSEFGMLPYMVPRFFGLRAFATLYAVIYAAAAIATGVGPYVMGLAFDMTASYRVALIFFEFIIIIVAILIFMLPKYTYDVNGSRYDGRKSRTIIKPSNQPDATLDAAI